MARTIEEMINEVEMMEEVLEFIKEETEEQDLEWKIEQNKYYDICA